MLTILNPVLAFVDASLWHQRHPLPSLAYMGYAVPGWAVTVALHLLIGGLFFIIAIIRVRWIRRLALRAGVGGDEREGGWAP
jgi:hypothetical protein